MLVKLPDRWLNLDYMTNARETDDGISVYYLNGGSAVELKYTGNDARKVKILLDVIVNTNDETEIERNTTTY